MKQVLDSLCDYRRYCWNKAIECWNDQYESRKIGLSQSLIDKLQDENGKLTVVEQELVNQYPTPSCYTVREELVRQKEDWQYELSSRVLQQAVKDVAKHGIYSLTIKTPRVDQLLRLRSRLDKVLRQIELLLGMVSYYWINHTVIKESGMLSNLKDYLFQRVKLHIAQLLE